jgi:hypothetical protein
LEVIKNGWRYNTCLPQSWLTVDRKKLNNRLWRYNNDYGDEKLSL